MSWMTKLAGLAVAVSLVGCAAPASKGTAEKTNMTSKAAKIVREEGKVEASTEESKKDSRIVCETVKRTGSHMRESYCYSVAERERDRERAQDEVKRIQQRGTRAGDQ